MNRIMLNFRSRNRRSLQVGSQRCEQRDGLTMTELIVSAVLLMTVMSFVTSLCFRVNLIWSSVGHHRVAVNELSNHLEELTMMTVAEATTAIGALDASEACCRALKSPVLSGEIIEDELGSRVILRINWDRPNDGNPTELSGWIVSGEKAQRDLDEQDEEEKVKEEKVKDGEAEPKNKQETPVDESPAVEKAAESGGEQ